MKKLLTLFAFLGLLSFVALPIYAQEDTTDMDDIVIETENLEDETEDVINVVLDETEDVIDEAAETVDETIDESVDAIDDINFDGLGNFNPTFDDEEAQNIFENLGVTDEEAIGIMGLIAGLGIGLLFFFGLFGFVLRILRIIALWKAFERAGEGGWEAIIPVYCTYTKFKVAGMKIWFWIVFIATVLLFIIGGLFSDYSDLFPGIITFIWLIVRIILHFVFARKYGWGVFASIIFVIFYPICILILGLGNYPYLGKSGKEPETIVEA